MKDIVIRQFEIKQSGCKAALVYLDGLVDKNSINNNILHPLMHETNNPDLITVGGIKSEYLWLSIEQAILHGKSVLFTDGRTDVLTFDTQGWPQRAIEDPYLAVHNI